MTSATANLAIIDTSVYVDNLRSRRFEKELLELKFVVRCSAVVLAELWRGARSKDMVKFAEYMARNFGIIAPNEREWAESGKVVRRLIQAKGYDANDFTAIHEVMDFNLICW